MPYFADIAAACLDGLGDAYLASCLSAVPVLPCLQCQVPSNAKVSAPFEAVYPTGPFTRPLCFVLLLHIILRDSTNENMYYFLV